MFCSNCGKSLKPEDDKCPHCGAAVGESRFDGSLPYTGAQEKLRPGKAVRSYGKHYTTDFVVGREKGTELPSDSDSSYRAAVGIDNTDNDERRLFNAYEDEDETADNADEEREDRSDEKHSAFGFRFLHRKKDDEKLDDGDEFPEDEEIGEDGLTETERRLISAEDDFVPTKPVGISEDVSAYLQRQSENERREKERKEARKPRKKEKAEELTEEELTEELLKSEKPAKKKKTEKAEKPEKKQKAAKKQEDEADLPESDSDKEAESSGFRFPFGIFKKKEDDLEDDFSEEQDTEEISDEEPAGDDFDDFEDELPKKRFQLSLPKRKPKPKKEKNKKKKPEPAEEPEDVIDEADEEVEYGEEEYNLERQKKGRMTLIKNIAIIAAALAIIVAAVIGVSGVREKSKTAPIETVTLSLWNEGISVMENRVKDSYRKSMLSLYDKSNYATYLTLQAAFTGDLDGLADLMPEAPMQHDQVFINALKAIQESINNCLSNDALSMTDSTKTAAEKDADSALRWEAVQDVVDMLKNSTNVGQLEAIIKGERVALIQKATEAPTPTETPAPYTTLAKGAKGLSVSNLQSRLSELGYLNASIDGDYGNKTKTAVEKFQQAAGLGVTGIADVETQELLYSDSAPKAK